MDGARRDVVETAGQLRWAAVAAAVVGLTLGFAGAVNDTFAGVLTVGGFIVYVVMSYLRGRYGDD